MKTLDRQADLRPLPEETETLRSTTPKRATVIALLLATCIATALPLTAARSEIPPETDERKSVRSLMTTTPPEIDGRLDDALWRQAPLVDDFHQIQPEPYGEPTQRTEVRVAHDADYLYVGVHLHDVEPQRISAKQLIQGGGIWSDDRFFVILDTFDDRRNAFFFSLNGNGVRREALISGQSFNDNWDAIWQGDSRVGETGITMEMAIPFKSLAFDPGSEIWGINFGRIIPRTNEQIYWSSRGQQDFPDSPAFGGRIEGLTGLRQGLGLDMVPTLVGSAIDLEGGSSSETEPALDIFYRPTPGLTAAVTLNTDFSATEVDARQINTDRFSLFFPEKRDFFLQDAGIFNFGGIGGNGQPFFSRRMGLDGDGRPVPIRWGAKVTGRQGRFNYGLLDVEQDSETGSENLFVGRASVNLLEESSVGAIVTHGDPVAGRDNTLFGADFRYRDSSVFEDKVVEADVWFQRSSSDGVEGRDGAYGASLTYPNDRWFVGLEVSEIEENFRPALGFVNRTGIRELMPRVRYRIRPQSGPIRAVNTWLYYERLTDTDDRLLTSRMFYFGSLEGQKGDWLTYQWLQRREVLQGPFQLLGRLDVPAGDFSWDEYRLFFDSSTHRRTSLHVDVFDGGFFDGERTQVAIEVQLRPSKHLFLSGKYDQADFQMPSGRFITRQATLRTNVAFTSTLSWSNLVQFDNLSDTVGLNSRFRWIPQAGRELFLVVNQGWDVEFDNALRSADSQVTTKVGYTLRF